LLGEHHQVIVGERDDGEISGEIGGSRQSVAGRSGERDKSLHEFSDGEVTSPRVQL